MSLEDDVLAPFEDERIAQSLAAAQKAAAQAERAKQARVVEWRDGAGRTRHTLVRTDGYTDGSGEHHRAVTTIFSPDEWAAVEAAVLATRGLSVAKPEREGETP